MSLQKHEKVRHLSLIGNCKFGNRTLEYILYVCPNLPFLNLQNCQRITSKGVREIIKACGSPTRTFRYWFSEKCYGYLWGQF